MTSSPCEVDAALERPAGQRVAEPPPGSPVAISIVAPPPLAVATARRPEAAGTSPGSRPVGRGEPDRRRRRRRARQAGPARPRRRSRPAADDRHPVGQELRLVHVVGGQEDRLARARAGSRSRPTPGAEPTGRTPWWARRGRAAPGRRSAPGRRRAGAAGRRRGCRRARRRSPRARRGSIVSSTSRGDEVVAGVEREGLANREHRLHPALLEDDPDPLAPGASRRPPGRGRARSPRPRSRLAVALEDLDGRRLARAVRA